VSRHKPPQGAEQADPCQDPREATGGPTGKDSGTGEAVAAALPALLELVDEVRAWLREWRSGGPCGPSGIAAALDLYDRQLVKPDAWAPVAPDVREWHVATPPGWVRERLLSGRDVFVEQRVEIGGDCTTWKPNSSVIEVVVVGRKRLREWVRVELWSPTHPRGRYDRREVVHLAREL